MIKNVFFDLDATLLQMNQDLFLEKYFMLLHKKALAFGYNGQDILKLTEAGVYKMLQNNGVKTNEEVYWNYINEKLGNNNLKDFFEDFYNNDFNECAKVVNTQPYSNLIIKELKEKNYNVIVATNPVFPKICTDKRLKWAGVDINDLLYVSTYENSSYTKPKKEYFMEILNKLNLRSDETIMIGNDMEDDFLNIKDFLKCILIKDCLINKKNVDINIDTYSLKDFYNEVLKFPRVI